ncbi:LPP20 family lipoprotein [candidate division KSB1 bacterium]|nr:LPP20 family lipoprotein [candidate division KSB1 bacterium]
MRSFVSLIVCAAVISVMGCGGSKPLVETKASVIPEWFSNTPKDPNFLYAARTATSRDLGLAIDKALTNARAEIARQYEVKVTGLTKSFQEEIGSSEDSEINELFSQTVKTVVSTTLVGSRASKTTHVRDGNNYRAYVLVEYPIGAANQAFMNALKANQNMYTQFRASEAFKEMDEEVQKYEEWKKEQAQK